jgi:hypothetical protein
MAFSLGSLGEKEPASFVFNNGANNGNHYGFRQGSS